MRCLPPCDSLPVRQREYEGDPECPERGHRQDADAQAFQVGSVERTTRRFEAETTVAERCMAMLECLQPMMQYGQQHGDEQWENQQRGGVAG